MACFHSAFALGTRAFVTAGPAAAQSTQGGEVRPGAAREAMAELARAVQNPVADNMRTEAFVPFWSRGRDSFLADPPNADMSIIEGGELRQAVVVLRNPVLEGSSLACTVQVLAGTMPDAGDEVSIFIDVIGMPCMSFAGAARCGHRRAWMR